jgi:hypothetical protein
LAGEWRMPLSIVMFQWIRDHPYQTFFWLVPIIITPFAQDIRNFIGFQFVSLRKAWLQINYVRTIRLLSGRVALLNNANALVVACTFRILFLLALIGLIIFIYSLYAAMNAMKPLTARGHAAAMLAVNFLGYLIAVQGVQWMLVLNNLLRSAWFHNKQKKLTNLRHQLELYGIDVSVLEGRNGITSEGLLSPKILENLRMRGPRLT